MLDPEFYSISFQTISFFLAIIKYGSMTTAATALHVTQPLISQRLAALESLLGFPLFYRDKRRMTLTPAGKLLAERWQASLGSIELSIQEARRLVNHSQGKVTLGVFGGLNESIIFRLVKHIWQTHPTVRLETEIYALSELREKYYSAAVDYYLFPDYGTLSLTSSVHQDVAASHFYAVAHRGDPLMRKDILSVEDLKERTFLVLSSDFQYFYTQTILNICSAAGFSPSIQHMVNEATLRLNISAGKGITLTNRFYDNNEMHDFLCGRPIADTTVSMCLLWRKQAPDTVHRFGEELSSTARQFFQKLENWQKPSFPL